ncbi:unnamed protein product [Urochloa decumbens]|uniref:Uncharacterized protein n=1 Tax=Urochloa decumbens TaxID=240449 RepID=A0ABC8V8F0_9POAL
MPKRLCRGCSERLCRNCYERFGFSDPGEHLYLVVDDWSSGYNIRKINLPSGTGEDGSAGEGAVQRLPPGFMNLDAERGVPEFFTSAFGTKIMATHPNLPEIPVPIIDLDRKTVLPGPETNCPAHPIYFPVGSDKDLDGYVGLSKDPESLGYLYFCDMTRTDTDSGLCPCPDVKCSKVKVFNKNLAERHLGATLMYMHHSKFCIVECVSVDDVKADQALHELSGTEASSGSIYMYRVITFTIKYNRRPGLKVKNHRVQCYKVPREATSEFIHKDPVAFWL